MLKLIGFSLTILLESLERRHFRIADRVIKLFFNVLLDTAHHSDPLFLHLALFGLLSLVHQFIVRLNVKFEEFLPIEQDTSVQNPVPLRHHHRQANTSVDHQHQAVDANIENLFIRLVEEQIIDVQGNSGQENENDLHDRQLAN